MKYLSIHVPLRRDGRAGAPVWLPLLLLAGAGLTARTPARAAEAPQVQLTAATYRVTEDAGFATLTVERTGDTTGSSSVTYTTSDVTTDPHADADDDYEPISNSVFFGEGETRKEFFVTVKTDSIIEPEEPLRITLSNPEGATLGLQSVAPLTIVDAPLFTAPQHINYSFTNTTVRLTWSDDCDNESKYEVERKKGSGDFVKRDDRPADSTTFTESGLERNTRYSYRVRAVNEFGASAYSPTVSFTIGGGGGGGTGRIRISRKTLGFGTVKRGKRKGATFQIQNVGNEAVSLEVVDPTLPFYVFKNGGTFRLKPNKTRTVSVAFAPTAKGKFRDTLHIRFVDFDGGGSVKLKGKGK